MASVKYSAFCFRILYQVGQSVHGHENKQLES